MQNESCRYAIKLLELGSDYKTPSYDAVRDLMRRSASRQGTTRAFLA